MSESKIKKIADKADMVVGGLCGLMAYTPQGYRGGVRPDSAPAAFGALDRAAFVEIQTATSLIFLGFAAVAFCLDLSCLPCRGGEVGESARRSAITQSSNLGCGDGLLRRMGDVAPSQIFYTISTSTRLKKHPRKTPIIVLV